MDRRAFLKVAPACLALAACATMPTYRASLRDGSLLVDEAELSALWEKGSAVIVSHRTQSAVLLRLGEGQYRALEADCPHLGCRVRPAAEFIACPCHGSTFDLEGRLLRGPAKRSLRQYPVLRRARYLEIAVFSQ
jgi:Rieske Fe-S protein